MRELTPMELTSVAGGTNYWLGGPPPGTPVNGNNGILVTGLALDYWNAGGEVLFGSPWAPYMNHDAKELDAIISALKKTVNCYTPGSVNYGAIDNHEGGVQLKAYIPTSTSGVTIAAGIDLSNQGSNFFSEIGLTDQSLINELTPYLNQTSQQAESMPWQSLAISPQQATELDQAFGGWLYNTVAQAYEGYAGVPFSDLSAGIQTALMDVAYNIPTANLFSSITWADALNGNWSKVAADLQGTAQYVYNGTGGNATRRIDDANMILNDIKNGDAPANALDGHSC